MKTKYAIAAALLISVGAFAQKSELKAMKKIMKNEQPSPAELQELKQLIDKAEPMIANADNEQKAEFYYYKGNYSLTQAMATQNKAALDEAIESFDKVLEAEKGGKPEYSKQITETVYPEVEATLVKMAGDLGKQSKFKEAVPLYEAAYKIDKKDTLNLYNAAAFSVNAKDYDTALKYYEELDRLGFTNSRLNYTAKNPEGEVEYFADKATRDLYLKSGYTNPGVHKDPSIRGDIVKNIALLYIQKGDNEKAKMAIEKAKKQNPDDIGLLQAEAQIYYETKDMDAYKRTIKQILDMGSTDPNLYFNLGVTTAQAGQPEEAKQYYKKAVEIDPKYANAYYNLAILELSGEDKIVTEMNGLGTSQKEMARYDALKKKRDDMYKAALAQAKKAYDLDPENEAYIGLLSSLYMGLDMMDEANALKK